MRRLIISLLSLVALSGCRERTGSESVSAPSSVDAGDVAKTKMYGDAAAAVFRAFVGKAPLNQDTGEFFHFKTLSCQGGKCTATLGKAGHEMLLAAGDVQTQMQIDGEAAGQATQALASAGANPVKVDELCCLTDGIKFGCSFVAPTTTGNATAAVTPTETATGQTANGNPASGGSVSTNAVTGSAASGSATATTSTTTTATTTGNSTTTIPAKKKPILGSCYCGLYEGYCMIFKYGDDNALGYKKASTCPIPDCQQNFATFMINQCERVWRVWPVE